MVQPEAQVSFAAGAGEKGLAEQIVQETAQRLGAKAEKYTVGPRMSRSL
jgi:hypothetical protein